MTQTLKVDEQPNWFSDVISFPKRRTKISSSSLSSSLRQNNHNNIRRGMLVRPITLWTVLILSTMVCRLFWQCPHHVDSASSSSTTKIVVPPRRPDEQNLSVEARALETPCPKDTVLQFITYGVHDPGFQFWKPRWGKEGIGKAIRILYSSLSRTYQCAVELHVHTNVLDDPVRRLLQNDIYTTMGTNMMPGLQFHPVNETAWKKNNPYLNPKLVKRTESWLALSRSKIDTMESYLIVQDQDSNNNNSTENDNNEKKKPLPVWIDLDTLIFDKSAVGYGVEPGRPWVHGYLRSHRTLCYGDIFSLDQSTINEIRSLEQTLIQNQLPLPHFDLQGYFGMLLEQNESRLEIIQEYHPDLAFGFDCGGGIAPYPQIIKDKVKRRVAEGDEENNDGGLNCTIFRTKSW